VLAYNFKKYNWVFYGICWTYCISRISVGAHYPFDVIGGAVIGAINWLSYSSFILQIYFQKGVKKFRGEF
jgi:membrane-associated phospholipid phosphatase